LFTLLSETLALTFRHGGAIGRACHASLALVALRVMAAQCGVPVRRAAAAWFAGCLLLAMRLEAGGGPENVALVINARSWASQTVAWHFAQVRQIPASNWVYVDWPASNEQTDVARLRRDILQPVLATLAARGVAGQIDYVVYSADFPWLVDCSLDAGGLQLPPQHAPAASLTGLTVLWPLVNAGRIDYLRLDANRYYRPPFAGAAHPAAGEMEDDAVAGLPPLTATHGFRNWYGWGPEPRPREAGGSFHLLSTMLGVVSGRGNSVQEVLSYLSRSAAADGTHPQGTIYFVRNADVRSRTRDAAFAAVARAIEAHGVRAAVIEGVAPQAKADVQGVQMGIADFDWPASGSQILPGAICDHLTSFGGVLSEGAGQTPLTEFLRHGAAGACGTVVEPFAMAAKFPHPAMHLHYVRGCTLAEAVYQSVAGPYQLLVVGDPLCRPWARIPQVDVPELRPGDVVRGTVASCPQAAAHGPSVDRFVWFVDGIQVGEHAAGETFSLQSESLPDGYHELRVVAIEGSDIESQGRWLCPVTIANHGRTVQLELEPPQCAWGETVTIRLRAAGAAYVGLLPTLPGVAPLAKGPEAVLRLNTRGLGLGLLTLQAAAAFEDDPHRLVRSAPAQLEIRPPPLIAAAASNDAALKPGLLLKWGSGSHAVVERADARAWLAECGVPPGTPFMLQGEFQADDDGWWQLQLRHSADVALEIDAQRVYESQGGDADAYHYLPLFLAAGRHRFQLTGQADEIARLELRLGAAGLRVAGSAWCQHEE
jgi:uncharacterized protein (TIGR03790 family)